MGDPQDAAPPGTLRIAVRERPKQSLRHTTVILEVDGVAYAGAWGVHDVPVRSGRHRVAVAFRYLGGLRGRAECTVTIPPGGTGELEYTTPWFLFGTHGRLQPGAVAHLSGH